MRIGIVGGPNSGKTTIFNALTRSATAATAYSSGQLEVHTAVVDVPDARLEFLAQMFAPRKAVFAQVTYNDIAGLTGDKGRAGQIGGPLLNAIAANDGISVEIHRQRHTQGVPVAPGMQAMVEEAARISGFPTQRVPSGAGHDAQAIAAITDMAMIFVPSVDGISHSPEEYSTPQDCANGAQVLMNLLLLADRR